MTSYSFRLRVNRAPRTAIQCAHSDLVLASSAESKTITLRSGEPPEPLKDARRYVLHGHGYATDHDAQTAGRCAEAVLMVALARVRVGVDFGYRAPTSSFSAEGLKWMGDYSGARTLNDVHGLTVYETEPGPKFVSMQMNATFGIPTDRFHRVFNEVLSINPVLTDQEKLAFTLFNASFFQSTAESRFILLAMAIEATIQLAPRSNDCMKHVEALTEATKVAALPNDERDSMLATIKSLANESISQAGRRLSTSRLGHRKYGERTPAKYFTEIYDIRSRLVHGGAPYPTWDEVNHAAAELEVFVSDLLTAPYMDLPVQGA